MRKRKKFKCLFCTALILAVASIGFAQSKTKEIAPETVVSDSVKKNHTVIGELEIGATESLITQSDEGAADYAAYCFTNKSAVGAGF